MKEKYSLLNDDPVIRTYTGKWINVFNTDPELLDIEDIAHALSFQCRFGGHIKEFYSVAQHSIFCYNEAINRNLPLRIQLTALMHDASEAYLVDIPRPIKGEMPYYKLVENKLMEIISKKFGLIYPFTSEIKDIDNYALQVEWDSLMIQKEDAMKLGFCAVSFAKTKFLDIFYKLQTELKDNNDGLL